MRNAYIKHIISLLLFGLNGIIASKISLPSVYIVLCRTFFGSLLLLILYLLRGNRFTLKSNKRDVFFIMISGTAMGSSWMFLFEAYRQIGVSIASLLYYCGPVIVMMFSPLLFGERLTLPKITGFLTVIVGVVFINGFSPEKTNTHGIILGLLSAVTYSIMVMANKKCEKIVGMQNSLLQLIFAFITVGIFVLCKNGFYFPAVQTTDIFYILFIGIVITGFGCFLYFFSIRELPVQSVAVLGYIEPLSAVLFSVIILGDVLSFMQIIGAALIISGAVVGELVKK